MGELMRTVYCGLVAEKSVGQNITVSGWVRTKRDMGGIVFVDLFDREGVLQVVFDSSDMNSHDFALADALKIQSVITVQGVIEIRSEDTYNANIPTGTIELRAKNLIVQSVAKTLPFPLEEGNAVREDLRLKYRYLDIRRPEMLGNLRLRHRVQRAIENYLDSDGFISVETPILCKSTPEGARDYLVPSRVHAGEFYALPQSPQIFKQLLMVGGVDKYYQVARCFRDEDLRADRQPEFTQVDMEMSFCTEEDVLTHLEKLFKHVLFEVMGLDFKKPFPRMSYHEAMETYGCDKPDLRFDLPIVDVTDIAAKCSFSVFKNAVTSGGVVRAINVDCKSDFTRTEIEDLTNKAQALGAKGMAWISYRPDGEIYSILTKYFTDREMKALLKRVGAKKGDFILFSADKYDIVCKVLAGLRLAVGDMLGLRKKDDYKFVIVNDFPMFEWDDDHKRYVAKHHPFTKPHPEDIEKMSTEPDKARALSYDVVLNGTELGSGSIRINDSELQHKMFEMLGFSDEEIAERFGFMIGAFSYGTPPHGGFAFGLDRLVMLLLGADSLRDVIAFPKNKDASCPMTGAPTEVDISQLHELALVGAFTDIEERERFLKQKEHKRIDVMRIAELSHLRFSEKDITVMEEDMLAIVDFADALSKVDTEGVPITAHVLPMSNVLREDIATDKSDRAELLSNAKTKTEEYIYVPKSFE